MTNTRAASVTQLRIPTTVRRRLAPHRPPVVVAQVFRASLAVDELFVRVEAGGRAGVLSTAAALRALVVRGGCQTLTETESPYGRRPTVTFTFTPAPRALGLLALAIGFDVEWDPNLYDEFTGSLVDPGTAQAPALELALAS